MKYLLYLLLLTCIAPGTYSQYKPANRYVYAQKGTDTLWMDDYRPAVGPNGISVVFVHGGAFTGGDPENQFPMAEGLNKLGYRVLVLKYRLYLKGKSFGCDTPTPEKLKAIHWAVEDIADAGKYIGRHATALNIDTTKMVLSGSSAGAEAILHALYNPFVGRKQSQPSLGVRYKAAMSFAGALVDLQPISKGHAIPLLSMHGTNDQLVPFETAPHRYCKASDQGWMMMFGPVPIAQKMKTLDVPVVLYNYKGAGHEVSNFMFRKFNEMDLFMKGVFNRTLQSSTHDL
ncbi:MAG: alpha/beta hydrolase [Chitinophagaceae bacterium]